MYIKPRQVLTQDGLMLADVYDPERKDRLPPEGRDVPDTPYWRRRVSEGGVEFAEPPYDENLPLVRGNSMGFREDEPTRPVPGAGPSPGHFNPDNSQ